jgi:hypothetical protein
MEAKGVVDGTLRSLLDPASITVDECRAEP